MVSHIDAIVGKNQPKKLRKNDALHVKQMRKEEKERESCTWLILPYRCLRQKHTNGRKNCSNQKHTVKKKTREKSNISVRVCRCVS